MASAFRQKWVQVFFRCTLNLPAFKCIPNMFESRQFQVVTTMNDVTDIFANCRNLSKNLTDSQTQILSFRGKNNLRVVFSLVKHGTFTKV